MSGEFRNIDSSFKIERLFRNFSYYIRPRQLGLLKSCKQFSAKSTLALKTMKKNKVGSIVLNDDARQKILNPNQRQILEDNRRIHERMLQLTEGGVPPVFCYVTP
jgi:hypothetical protein